MPITLTWLGHATFKIQTPEGKILLIDPWTEHNPSCPQSEKRQNQVDVMLCTHGHGDHIGDAVAICRQLQPTVVGIYELASWLGSKGAKNIAPMNKGGTQEVAGVKITMVHAVHSCGIQEDDGSMIYGGEACGYVLEFSDGLRLYHAGDTAVFGDMQIIHELYRPEIALLPMGDHFTMGPREAEYACKLLKPRVVVPMHFGTFPMLTGDPHVLENFARQQGFELWIMEPGVSRKLRTPVAV
jgi:L-ascorbate metabolism protein UlaG (beta-lactamase superfamily)